MFTISKHKLYYKDNRTNYVGDCETHLEKQVGDIGLKAANGDIVYVSTSPPVPNGMEDAYNFGVTGVHVRFPEGEFHTGTPRRICRWSRPTAMKLNFSFRASNWRGKGRNWFCDVYSKCNPSCPIHEIDVMFADNGLKKIQSITISLFAAAQDDQRFPCRINATPRGMFRATLTADTLNPFHNKGRANYVTYSCGAPALSWNISKIAKGLTWTITSDDKYLV